LIEIDWVALVAILGWSDMTVIFKIFFRNTLKITDVI